MILQALVIFASGAVVEIDQKANVNVIEGPEINRWRRSGK